VHTVALLGFNPAEATRRRARWEDITSASDDDFDARIVQSVVE
jgi:hypothetical protein